MEQITHTFTIYMFRLFAALIAISIVGLLLKFAANRLFRALLDSLFDSRNKKLINSSTKLQDLLSMTPDQFEHMCRLLFQNQGYQVSVTRPCGDGGIDLIMSSNGAKMVAQCKRYSNRAVGRPELQKFYGTFEDNSAVKGFFITTSKYTQPAREFAAGKPIELIDGGGFAELVNRYAGGQITNETPAVRQEHKSGFTGTCADCGAEASLPFTPSPGKKIYCRECYYKHRRRSAA